MPDEEEAQVAAPLSSQALSRPATPSSAIKTSPSASDVEATTVSRRLKRPSTAPPAQDAYSATKFPLLPIARQPPALIPEAESASTSSSPEQTKSSLPYAVSMPASGTSIHLGKSQTHRVIPGLPRLPTQRVVPPESPSSAPVPSSAPAWPTSADWSEPGYDWTAFVNAYAAGQWDPNHIPTMPQSSAGASFPFPSVPLPSVEPKNGASVQISPPMPRLVRSYTAREASDQSFNRMQSTSSSSKGSRATSSSDQWSKGSPSTGPSSAASAQVPLIPLQMAHPPSSPPLTSLASRRGGPLPELSTLPLVTPQTTSNPASTTSTRSPYAGPYGPGRPRLKASSSSPGIVPEPDLPQDPAVTQDRAAVAATMRWAGSGVAIAPLALPSPERELVDPMRNATPSLPVVPSPGEHPLEVRRRRAVSSSSSSSDHGKDKSASKRRSYWDGFKAADSPEKLSVIPGSASETPSNPASDVGLSEAGPVSHVFLPTALQPASAPLPQSRGPPKVGGDYFNLVAPRHRKHPEEREESPAPSSNSSPSPSPSAYATPAPWETPAPAAMTRPTSELKPGKYFPQSVPMPVLKLPTLAPIPSSPDKAPDAPPSSAHSKRPSSHTQSTSVSGTDSDPTVTSGQTPAQVMPPPIDPLAMATSEDMREAFASPLPQHLFGRSTSFPSASPRRNLPPEEVAFHELGYLIAPEPPNELDRRRALYKFNVLHTGADMNFDRLVHLAKLVFGTKMVMISLIDASEQWFKSEAGMEGVSSTGRDVSFCAHTILQRDDEPLVVLNALEDWRFARNPLVTQGPNIKFYAGAPLRTADGFNIGSLCIADDHPRTEFSPRQRHTLKEFAGVVMRELELWKDKIQLRIRDRIQTSMEQFTRECLEIDSQSVRDPSQHSYATSSMDKIYERAVRLVKRTLDVEGALVMDVSHFEVVENQHGEGSHSILLYQADTAIGMKTHPLSSKEYDRITDFFVKNPDGKVVEGVVPACFKGLIPANIQYALIVPVFNVDKRPFALLCAYNSTHNEKPFLEGHELSYLRAIGVIILSAVLKRRMILADKSKSLFISNISHELRTPLHGILAAAELLQDTTLDHHQASILQTVQACGTSLVETVNHVLDFTKLSGNAQAGGVENVILPTKVDLMQLVEEAVEGCWIGYRARASALGDADIGSVYSPPRRSPDGELSLRRAMHVETVVDIELRDKGWNVKCEKGGLRRVLMNLIGNSLKFTQDGDVHIILRELPAAPSTKDGYIRIELGVFDTGKGISKEFLKNQLFHPFSQENPLQTGTGLGLAIVYSIIRSKSMDGDVDVWSAEGVGTEIRITLDVQVSVDSPPPESETDPWARDANGRPFSVSFVGFNSSLKGEVLLLDVVKKYLVTWWGFVALKDNDDRGDILLINEDSSPIIDLLERKSNGRPIVVLSSFRGDATLVAAANAYERSGGFCRIVFKPGGPSRLRHVMKLCAHILNMSPGRVTDEPRLEGQESSQESLTHVSSSSNLQRRRSDEVKWQSARPQLQTRSSTYHSTLNPIPNATALLRQPSILESPPAVPASAAPVGLVPSSSASTVSLGGDNAVLRRALGSLDSTRLRVLIVEDNQILRELLTRWLRTKGYEHQEAFDGQQGVNAVESNPPGYFDVVLIDVSMPVMDGITATSRIRQIEAVRRATMPDSPDNARSARIVALTGMSSLEDKRRAFEAGVDAYLVKPVAFKTLDLTFQQFRTT